MTRPLYGARELAGSGAHEAKDARVSLFGVHPLGSSQPHARRLEGLRDPRRFRTMPDNGLFLGLFAVGVALLALAAFVSESFGAGL